MDFLGLLHPNVQDAVNSTTPIRGGVDNPPQPSDIPSSTVGSISDIADTVGNIFDRGWSIYDSIRGRRDADAQIQQDTVAPNPINITVDAAQGFYTFYQENKVAVLAVVGGLAILTGTLISKKIGWL